MSVRRGSVCVESLENRAYARASSRPMAAEPALPDLTPMQAAADPAVVNGVLAYVDGSRTLRLRGTFGDDRVTVAVDSANRVRVQGETSMTVTRLSRKGSLNVIFYNNRRFDKAMQAAGDGESGRWSRWSTATARPAGRFTMDYTFSETFACTGGFDRIVIEGGDGADTLSVTGMSVPVTLLDVEASNVPQSAALPGQTPSDPIRTGKYHRGGGWDKLAARERSIAKASRASTAFFGDSHADLFPQVGRVAWQTYFPRAVALGIGGDSTRQLLTRIQDGVFDTFKPDRLVLSVGANNLNHPATGGTDAQITAGVLAVVDALRAKLPRTRLVLMGLLPRNGTGLNDRVKAINASVSVGALRHRFTFVNVYDRFAAESGRLLTASSHLTPKGYSALASMLSAALRT